jgi:TonB-linked SusC/RagA family outer membrane protein
MNKILLTLLWFLMVMSAFAQKITVKGTVVDNEGIELIGASVVVKADATNPIGTITDISGQFTIEVPSSASILVFSYIGYNTLEVPVNGKTELKIVLESSIHSLDAVVVTALGIKKEKKALGYAFADVNGDELTTNRDVNFINKLSNKIAGVNISQTAGGPGTSTRIVIRGIRSLSTESQPLVVVDGVALDGNVDGASWLGGLDYGNSLSSISPDDIETMSVLKGPNAAALYGSRAANGVIMITTKKGTKRDQMKVTLNSNFMFDRAYILGKYQNDYGAGFGGAIQKHALTPEEQAKYGLDSAYYYYSTGSWGPKLDGTMEVINWNGKLTRLTPQPDNVKDYFNHGSTFTNSLAIEKGNEKYNWRLSVSNLDNKGIKPNSTYDRTTVNYNMNSKLNDILTASFKANYIRENALNREGQSDSRTGARTFIWMPRSINMDELREDYKDEFGNEQNWYKADDWHTNPYWESYENYNNDFKDQFIGYIKLDFNITDWLTGYVRSSMDTYSQRRFLRIANNALRAYGEGQYTEGWIDYRSLNHDFLLTAKKTWFDDWTVSGNIGGNYLDISRDRQSTTIKGLAVPNFFSINNSKNPGETETGTSKDHKRIQSLYASAQLEYKNWWFLEITDRMDWSSTLPPANWRYNYPSVNTSIIFTDALGMGQEILSFGKIRGSIATVGNDTHAHQLSKEFISQNFGGIPAVHINNEWTNLNLKSERTRSFEFGADLRFWNNKIGFDFTYYNETTFDQIINAEVPSESGAYRILTNGGDIANKGMELQLNVTPFEKPEFKWEISVNFAKNKNEVVSLAEGVESLSVGGESQFDLLAVPGKPYGELIGSHMKRYYKTDNDGNIVDDPNNGKPLIGSDGLYVIDDRSSIGNIQPDWTGGLTNSIRYKNLSLAFSIGVQMGGDLFSKTNKYGLDNGQFTETLEGRESWYAATTEEQNAGTVGYVADGVLEDGTINTRGIDPQVYWHQHKWGGIAELDVYDATYVKLRDVTLNYDFPDFWFENKWVKSASLSFVAKNVWLIYSGVPNIDPESSFGSGNSALGQEYAAMPPTRSFGFNLKVVF